MLILDSVTQGIYCHFCRFLSRWTESLTGLETGLLSETLLEYVPRQTEGRREAVCHAACALPSHRQRTLLQTCLLTPFVGDFRADEDLDYQQILYSLVLVLRGSKIFPFISYGAFWTRSGQFEVFLTKASQPSSALVDSLHRTRLFTSQHTMSSKKKPHMYITLLKETPELIQKGFN